MRILRSVAYNWKEGGITRLASKVGHRLRRLISFRYEAIVYRLRLGTVDSPELPEDVEIRELTLDELLEAGYFKAVAFPELMAHRFSEGDRCVGVYFSGSLGHVSWMSPGRLPIDPGLPVVPLPDGVGIHGMFTLREFRGRGAQTAVLLHLCRMAADAGFDQAVAMVREDNAPSRHVFSKCGFQELEPLRYSRRLWMARLEYPEL